MFVDGAFLQEDKRKLEKRRKGRKSVEESAARENEDWMELEKRMDGKRDD